MTLKEPNNTCFVIFFQGRSGSTYLVEALDSHPQIHCEIERLVSLRKGGASAQLDWVEAHLKGACQADVGAIGFKTKLDDVLDKDSLACLLRKLEAKVILLSRANVVKMVISWFNSERLYAETGDWNLYPPTEPLPPLMVDVEKFDRRLGLVLHGKARLQAYVGALQLATLRVSYEDLLIDEDAVLAQACNLLQVDPLPLQGHCTKVTDDDLRHAVRNFDQLYVRYRGTAYQQMFDEVLRPTNSHPPSG